MEETIHRLELENTRIDAAWRNESKKVESLHQDLSASQEVTYLGKKSISHSLINC